MFVRAQLYRDVGGFDERFFMFYEDVDLGCGSTFSATGCDMCPSRWPFTDTT